MVAKALEALEKAKSFPKGTNTCGWRTQRALCATACTRAPACSAAEVPAFQRHQCRRSKMHSGRMPVLISVGGVTIQRKGNAVTGLESYEEQGG
eukprot:1185243-Prorocentrum_minimum.AAC.1